MSTAWYKPNRLPKRIRSWTSSSGDGRKTRSLEVWETTCVVTNMNATKYESEQENMEDGNSRTPFSVLINPANPSLSGVSKFSYFPVGGPEPPENFQISKDSHPIMGYVTSWGGMEVGKGMAFASNTVDGIVHQYGGKELLLECENALGNRKSWLDRALKRTGNNFRLKEGQAITTKVTGEELKFASGFDFLVHTVPPFYNQEYRFSDAVMRQYLPSDENESSLTPVDDSWSTQEHNEFLLAECYRNSLKMASMVSPSSLSPLKIASPLLGAGCRGFPLDRAIQIAVSSTARWMFMKEKQTDSDEKLNPCDEKAVDTVNDDWMQDDVTLAFGIADREICVALIEAFDKETEHHHRCV